MLLAAAALAVATFAAAAFAASATRAATSTALTAAFVPTLAWKLLRFDRGQYFRPGVVSRRDRRAPLVCLRLRTIRVKPCVDDCQLLSRTPRRLRRCAFHGAEQ